MPCTVAASHDVRLACLVVVPYTFLDSPWLLPPGVVPAVLFAMIVLPYLFYPVQEVPAPGPLPVPGPKAAVHVPRAPPDPVALDVVFEQTNYLHKIFSRQEFPAPCTFLPSLNVHLFIAWFVGMTALESTSMRLVPVFVTFGVVFEFGFVQYCYNFELLEMIRRIIEVRSLAP